MSGLAELLAMGEQEAYREHLRIGEDESAHREHGARISAELAGALDGGTYDPADLRRLTVVTTHALLPAELRVRLYRAAGAADRYVVNGRLERRPAGPVELYRAALDRESARGPSWTDRLSIARDRYAARHVDTWGAAETFIWRTVAEPGALLGEITMAGEYVVNPALLGRIEMVERMAGVQPVEPPSTGPAVKWVDGLTGGSSPSRAGGGLALVPWTPKRPTTRQASPQGWDWGRSRRGGRRW